MKNFLKYFAIISAVNLIAVNSVLAATQPASENLLQEVKQSVSNLINTKDEQTLTPEEKEKQELEQRLDIYRKILDLSIKEVQDTKNQLKSLNNLDEKNISLRDQFIKKLDEFLKYYNEQKEILEKSPKTELQQSEENTCQNQVMNLARIKELAQTFKDWREENYLPEFRTITNFLLINQQKVALEMATNRFGKIVSDIEKLKKANIKGVDELKKSLDLADGFLKEAKDSRQEAEDLFWQIIERTSTATATSAAENNPEMITPVASSSVSNATSTENAEVSELTVPAPAENATSTTENSITDNASTTTPAVISVETQFLSIKNLIGDSLNKIKETYRVFIEMSSFVKKLLI